MDTGRKMMLKDLDRAQKELRHCANALGDDSPRGISARHLAQEIKDKLAGMRRAEATSLDKGKRFDAD